MTFNTTAGAYSTVIFDGLTRLDTEGNVISYKVTDEYAGNFSVVCGSTDGIAIDEETATASATITNTYYNFSAGANKVWEDGSDRDGKRTNSVVVKLQRKIKGSSADWDTYKTATLDSNNSWNVNWTDLPVYYSHKDNKVYEYRVIEDSVSGYDVEYYVISGTTKTVTRSWEASKDKNVHISAINKREPDLFTIKGTKSWDDSDNKYGQRPTEIQFKLQYSTDKKTWKDVEHVDSVPDPDKDTGDTVFTTSDVTQTLKASDNWKSVEWKNLPVYVKSGKVVYYRAVEIDVPDGYTSDAISGEQAGEKGKTFEVTIENELDPTSITVNKIWDPEEDPFKDYNFLPKEIDVQVQYRKAGDTNWKDLPKGGKATLNKGNQWTKTFNNLNGSYEYRVIETAIRYSQTEEINVVYGTDKASGDVGYFVYTSSTTGNKTNGYTTNITNTIPKTELEVFKIWHDGDNRDGFRPESILIDLHMIDSNGKDVVIDKDVKLVNANGIWSHKWTQLPKMTRDGQAVAKYYVIEKSVDKDVYSQNYSVTEQTAIAVDENTPAQIDITNTHEPYLINVDGTKVWKDDDDFYGLRDKEVKLTLEYSLDGGKTWRRDFTTMDVAHRPAPDKDNGKTVYTSSETTQKIEPKDATSKEWTKAEWKDLSAYALNNDGKSVKVQYRVVELVNDVPVCYKMTPSATASFEKGTTKPVQLEVTNELVDVTEISATKVWEIGTDIANPDLVLPEFITVQLQYLENGDWVNVPKNSTGKIERINGTQFSTITFDKLRDDLEYRIIETSITYSDGSTIDVVEDTTSAGTFTPGTGSNAVISTNSGVVGNFEYKSETVYDENANVYITTLTNTLPETEFTVKKVWDDNNNALKRRRTITVNLYRDVNGAKKEDCLVATAKLTEENGWTYTWKHLPMYVNGSTTDLSVYTIEEIQISGYNKPTYNKNNVSFDDKGTAVIQVTNKVIPRTPTGAETDMKLYGSLFTTSGLALATAGVAILSKKRKEEDDEEA